MKTKLIVFVLMIASCMLYAQTRVTYGYPINITKAPWQVRLQMHLTNGRVSSCGGSIIAPNFILTAKHCLQERVVNGPPRDIIADSVKVIAGITCKDEMNSSNIFDVSEIIRHPEAIDAALLRLSNNITYNNNRQPVNYWASADNALYNVGNTTRVSGWGLTIPNDTSSAADCLQAVNLNIILNQDASNMLINTCPTWNRDLYDHEMAAIGTGDNRQGSCHGDSGGPLTTLTTTNEPVLIGIVHGGVSGCGGDNQTSPSVFVRVSHIWDWIHSVICATNYTNQTVDTNFTNQTVTTNTTVANCGTINVNNTTVTSSGTLNILATNTVNIGDGFTVQPGGGLNINVGGVVSREVTGHVWDNGVEDNEVIVEQIDVDETFTDTSALSFARVVADVNNPSIIITVAPNPAERQSGNIDFIFSGAEIRTGTLTIYDRNGNIVNRLTVNNNIITWNLRDVRGRVVSVGTYLVRGSIITQDGSRENVSSILGIR